MTSYHADPVGTNTLVVATSSSGQTVSRAALEPFGRKLAGTGTSPRHLFTDQERDTETGLDDFGARTYDPLVGRFLEPDPELVAGGVTFARIAGDPRHDRVPHQVPGAGAAPLDVIALERSRDVRDVGLA